MNEMINIEAIVPVDRIKNDFNRCSVETLILSGAAMGCISLGGFSMLISHS